MAAVNVGHPLAVVLAVVQVEHGGHSVHADAVGVVFLRPEQSVGDQEVGDLRSGVIVNQGSPVGMGSLSGIPVLVEAGAVVLRHAPGISGEVGGNPVQNHPDALAVHVVHEIHEIIRRAVPAGGGVISAHLVAPGGVQGMLHHRQKLHVGVPHLLDVLRQFRGDLPVIVKFRADDGVPLLVRLNLLSHKGTQMQLVDGHGLGLRVRLGPLVHPGLVVPFILFNVPDHGGRVGAQLRVVGVGVRLQNGISVHLLDLVFVERSLLQAGDEQLIHPVALVELHLMPSAVPEVEVSHHAHAHGAGGPHGEQHALHPVHGHGVGAQLLVNLIVDAGVKLF